MARVKVRIHLPAVGKVGDVVDIDDEQAARLAERRYVTYVDDEPIITQGPAQVTTDEDPDRPAGNASEDEWREYRLAHGYTEDELADKGRNDMRDLEDR
jgi:hypothetical protein